MPHLYPVLVPGNPQGGALVSFNPLIHLLHSQVHLFEGIVDAVRVSGLSEDAIEELGLTGMNIAEILGSGATGLPPDEFTQIDCPE